MSTTPSSGAHKTVTTVSGTGAATSPQRWQAWPRWSEVAAPVPEALVTVLCAPDDGCG